MLSRLFGPHRRPKIEGAPRVVRRSGPLAVALIRFSYLDVTGGWYEQTRGKALDDRAALIMRPARLERRFALFEQACLPSLVAQDPDAFGAIVLASDRLPKPYRRRLEAALAPHPNVQVAFDPVGDMRERFRHHLHRRWGAAGLRATVRLDDDDALSADFTERLSAYVAPAFEGFFVTFADGVGVKRIGEEVMAWSMHAPKIAAGLAYVAGGDDRTTIFDKGSHTKVCEVAPTILDSRAPSYLLTEHGANDLGLRPRRDRFPVGELDVRFPGAFGFIADKSWALLQPRASQPPNTT